MERTIEILAPAGSYEGMKAAMNAGCDAVYIGGSNFGARAYANNLEEGTLLHAIDEAHIRGKKLYLTINTLLKEKEHAGELYSFLEKFYLQGLDAVIVQDVGVLHFIHEQFPELPIHASTQMTLTMAQGANLLKDYGVTRLVPARELGLGEIKAMRENTDLEIETFVHGALCYCYSGQCLMSSMIGGRSGNRGRCAQPCRMPYQFYSEDRKLSSDQEKYLLSPKDINTIKVIPELIEAGVDSFKIEGRMKRPEYAAAVTHTYRKYVDLYLKSGKAEYRRVLETSEYQKDMLALLDVYNRGGFSEGYLATYHGKKMMSLNRPNHSGVFVGVVKEVKGSQVGIDAKEKIHAQDILEIRHKEEDGHEFTVKDPHHPGDIVWTNVGRRKLQIGDLVYRTKNNELLQNLAKEYLEKDSKIGIKGYLKARSGEPLTLTVSVAGCEVTAYQELVQEALKQPMTKEKLAAPVEKTGDTLYYFEELQVEVDENIFVPVAWLNEIRREALFLLQEAITRQYRRSLIKPEKTAATQDGEVLQNSIPRGFVVSIRTEEQFEVAINIPEVTAIYVEYDVFTLEAINTMAIRTKRSEKAFYLSLPHICRLAVFERLKRDLLEIIEKEEVTGFLIKNFEEIALIQSLCLDSTLQKDMILNYNMYTYNREAKVFWREKGITRFTAPMELNYQELKTIDLKDSDIVVYGYLPLMVSTQCIFDSTKGCGKQNVAGRAGTMVDRLGKNFFVQTNCGSCYNIIYNGQPLALHKQAEEILSLKPLNLRLDFTKESALQMNQVISVFLERFCGGEKTTQELSEYTTAHFKRGVE